MASVHQKKGNLKASSSRPRTRSYKSPLDRAAGWELNWPQTSPLFEAARPIGNPCFVYFIGEDQEGPIKIGSAKDPVLRLRGLQTGNPRQLQVEHVVIGDSALEFLLHELWEPFAIRSKRAKKVDGLPGTEWFRQDVRAELEPILKLAAVKQIAYLEGNEDGDLLLGDLEQLVREAHGEHGFVFKPRDEVHLLGATVGTVVRRRSRI